MYFLSLALPLSLLLPIHLIPSLRVEQEEWGLFVFSPVSGISIVVLEHGLRRVTVESFIPLGSCNGRDGIRGVLERTQKHPFSCLTYCY